MSLTVLIIASVVGIVVAQLTDTGCLVFSLKIICPLPLSARPIFIPLTDLYSSVLLEPPVCPWTYCLILIDGHQNFLPVTISLGDSTEWIPFCLGSELISIVIMCTLSMVNRSGILLHDIITITAQILSLRNEFVFRQFRHACQHHTLIV
jgi:hypothetical protein